MEFQGEQENERASERERESNVLVTRDAHFLPFPRDFGNGKTNVPRQDIHETQPVAALREMPMVLC